MGRLILSALRERRGETALLALLGILVVAAAAAGPLYAAAATAQAIAVEAAGASAAEHAITTTAEIDAKPDAASAAGTAAGEVGPLLSRPGLTEVRGAYVLGTISTAPAPSTAPTPTPATAPTPTPATGTASSNAAGAAPDVRTVAAALAARDGACAHLVLRGACPGQAGEVALSAPTAAELGVDVGATLSYRLGDLTPRPVRVVGVYDPDHTPDGTTPLADPYWAGRADLTPIPLRPQNPVYTVTTTIDQLGPVTVSATVDFLTPTRLTPAVLDQLSRPTGARSAPGPGYAVRDGVYNLLRRVRASQAALPTPVLIGAGQLVAVAWAVLLLGLVYSAAQRRTQVAMGGLRGAPRRTRIALTAGPAVLVLLAAAPVGLGLGWLLVRVLAWLALDQVDSVPLDVPTLATAGAVAVGVLVGAVVAQLRVHSGPVLDALREVPARRGGRVAGTVEVLAVVLAVAALTQSGPSADGAVDDAGTVLPALAAALLAVAAGVLLARIVRPVAAAVGTALLRIGRPGAALAALYVARRPGTDRLVALVVVVVALLGQAALGWQATRGAVTDQARLGLGAERVVTVRAPSRSALLHAVRRADPAGQWAMAVARERGSSGTTVAVDTSRLARVAYWPAAATQSAERAARRLSPRANDPIRITGAELALDVTVPPGQRSTVPVTVVLEGPKGEQISVVARLEPVPGRREQRLPVPVCATGDGCRLAWFSFPFSPDDVVFHRVLQHTPDAVVLDEAGMSAPARFRTEVGAESGVLLLPSAEGLSLRYYPADPRHPDPDIRIQASDTAVPLPVLVAGPPSVEQDGTVVRASAFGALPRPIDIVGTAPELPGVGIDGILVDLTTADRAADTFDNIAELQVWLAENAPADALDRLRAAGLVTVGTVGVDELVERGLALRTGPGARFHLGAALLALVLALVAVALIAAVDSGGRGAQLAALRTQGVPQRAVRAATRTGYTLVVAAAALAGSLVAVPVWLVRPLSGGPPTPVVLLAVLLPAAALLAGAALWVGGRLSRVDGLDLEEVR
ncbi:FtsX-like permease family protein [Catellatospora tritici]|uniref:FtsX-like permease family protein n=1 Tax=Catellatospora tritici TaxID=2851566 RepID=UPI001C2D3257|nr:FtsX-like permease family protein [Catellatospora tritici]MBV1852354.1 hypothetical protein [Catellatospora tritici]